MNKIIIEGPSKLKGTLKIQGAKNSAMKHVFVPLIDEGIFTLENIPRIGSIENHLKLINYLGAKTLWINKNSTIIDAKYVDSAKVIPKNLFYYTSDANKLIPILASKFGKVRIEINPARTDRGGDQIGSRRFDEIFPFLSKFGIETSRISNNLLEFKLVSKKPFTFNAPNKSFTTSMLAVFSALFKNGKSSLGNYTTVAEFFDVLKFLIKAGAKIKVKKDKMFIWGPTKLHSIKYRNMNDMHDAITCIAIALATNSEIKLEGLQFEKMMLQPLEKVLKRMGANIDLHHNVTTIKSQLSKLKSINIKAGIYPNFMTEWQVLFSPLLTQVTGTSNVVETIYSDRMKQWCEMKKMGADFKFYKDPEYPEQNNKPRAVQIYGSQNLHGAKVRARDVRCGAALVIAGLIASGQTEIVGYKHIQRGYDNLIGRLQKLGAKIKLTD